MTRLCSCLSQRAPYVEGLATRADLNALFMEMLGNLTVSHVAIHGGDIPSTPTIPVGLLGADYVLEKRALPFRANLRRRSLEPRHESPAHRTERSGKSRRISPGGQREELERKR